MAFVLALLDSLEYEGHGFWLLQGELKQSTD